MNLTVQVGRFTADPEIKTYADNKILAGFTLAVNRRFKQEGQTDADFFNYVAFGKTAEFIEKYFKKGMKAVVTGELRNNHYTDKNGVKHYSEQIIVSTIEFAESKGEAKNETTTSDGFGIDNFIEIDNFIDSEELPFN